MTRGRAGAVVLLALALTVVARAWVVTPQRVASSSMEPTVPQGSVVLVDRLGPRLTGLRHGDLVALDEPVSGTGVLKRVVGLPGDRVGIEDAVLVRDGAPVPEPWVDRASVDGLYYGPMTVPVGHVLVMGDDRAHSVDSRDYGPVTLGAVRGRVLLVVPW